MTMVLFFIAGSIFGAAFLATVYLSVCFLRKGKGRIPTGVYSLLDGSKLDPPADKTDPTDSDSTVIHMTDAREQDIADQITNLYG